MQIILFVLIMGDGTKFDLPCRYFESRDTKGKAKEMYPPGRIVFIRPHNKVGSCISS